MLRVPMIHAKPGMKLAMPVQHPDRADTVLLREGVDLTETLVTRLRQIRCREVWIEFPGLEEIREFIRPEIQSEHARVTAEIDEAMAQVREQWRPRLEYLRYRDAVQGLIDNLVEHPRAAIFASELVAASRPVLRHASNVSLLSILIGLSLDFYLIRERGRLRPHHARDVSSLGVGAMLHDIGVLRLDDDARERWLRDGDEDARELREHVHLGYRLVRPFVDAAAATTVLHHHQRYDGSGYPERRDARGRLSALRAGEIHVFARIAHVADRFDHLRRAFDPDADPVPTVRVLRQLRREKERSRVDPVVLVGLQNVVPPFPPGSMVGLSSGERAVVVAWSPLEPCRPSVRILPGSALASLEPGDIERRPAIDLRAQRDLSIVEIDGQDVRGDTYDVESLEELDLNAIALRMAMQPTGEASFLM